MDNKEKLGDLVPANRKKDPLTQLNILILELGSIAHGLHYASIRSGKERAAYLAEARLGLCDLNISGKLLAEECNWPWEEIEFDGLERFKERMNDARKYLESKES